MSKKKIEAFVHAAEQGDLDTINRLASEVDPEGVSIEKGHATALELASRHGHLGIVKLLLQLGVSPNSFGAHPAIARAALRGHVNIVSFLLQNGAQVDLAGEVGETSLMFAAGNAQLECARLLIEAGANVSHVSAMRKMPLSEAYSYEDRRKKRNPVVDLLIESGAKLSEHYQKAWKDWKRPEA